MALISGNPNLRLKIYDEEFSTIRGFIKATTSSLYGISAFVILFGLLNMVNMLISSAIVRKREFALLQAVGMTNQQLIVMITHSNDIARLADRIVRIEDARDYRKDA